MEVLNRISITYYQLFAAVYMGYMSKNLRLFHFRIFPF